MSQYRPEDVSSGYLETIETVPVEWVAIGSVVVLFVLIMGYVISVKLRRMKYRKRKLQRMRALEAEQSPGGKRRGGRGRSLRR